MTDKDGMTVDARPAFDFNRFTQPELQEAGYDVNINLPNGKPSGMVIRIAGPDSKRRKAVSKAAMNARIQAGKGRGIKLSAEEIEEANINEMVAGTISWRFPDGFDGPKCTPEEVRRIYTTHPEIFQQVWDAGNELANFTREQSQN